MLSAHNGKTWTEFPSALDEKVVWDWLRSLEERFLADAPRKLHTTTTANQFKERKGQMDLFFQTPAPEANGTFEYKHVLVVGEQKKSHDTGRFKATLLQLARYVRSVFATSRRAGSSTRSPSVPPRWSSGSSTGLGRTPQGHSTFTMSRRSWHALLLGMLL